MPSCPPTKGRASVVISAWLQEHRPVPDGLTRFCPGRDSFTRSICRISIKTSELKGQLFVKERERPPRPRELRDALSRLDPAENDKWLLRPRPDCLKESKSDP